MGEDDDYNFIHKKTYIMMGRRKLRKGSTLNFDYETIAEQLYEEIARKEAPRNSIINL